MNTISRFAQLSSDAFTSYDASVRKICSCSPSKTSIASKLFLLATTPIAYPLLGALALLSWKFSSTVPSTPQANEAFQTIEAFRKGTKLRKLLSQVTNNQEAIKLIRNAREDDAEWEIERLRGCGVLDSTREHKISSAIDSVMNFNKIDGVESQVKAQLTRAFEVKDLYKESHFVFLHAQALPWMVYSSLVKELARRFKPDLPIHNFKFLRTFSVGKEKSTKNFLQQFFGGNDTLKSYLQKKRPNFFSKTPAKVDDDKPSTAAKLLSVDAFFCNYSKFESNLYFLLNNSNMKADEEIIVKLSILAIKAFKKNLSPQDEIRCRSTITKMVEKLKDTRSSGNLFAICIPKKRVLDFAYRAHPYGSECSCHPDVDPVTILESLQEGNFIPCTQTSYTSKVPQYRLYMPAVQPGYGIDVHCLSPLSKLHRLLIKQNLRQLASSLP